MINLEPGDRIWLAEAPVGYEQPTGPTVIFDLSEYGVDPLTVLEAYEARGWKIVEAKITETINVVDEFKTDLLILAEDD